MREDSKFIKSTEAQADGAITSKPKYTLTELIMLCNAAAPISTELKAWEEMAPVGREQT